jgi:hypothetical protein
MTRRPGRLERIGKSLIRWAQELHEQGGRKHRGVEAWRSCISKIRWRTENEARIAKRVSEQRFGILLKIYPCGYCLGWHLAKKNKRKKK